MSVKSETIKITKQDLAGLKVTLKIYIRMILYIDNLFNIKSRNLESSEEENIGDALKQHGMFRRLSDQINSYSFTEFMLNQLFHEACPDTNPSKCGEYDEFSKLFREIKFTKFDIEEFQRKLFNILDIINAKITQTKKVKAMKSKITKLINNLNNASTKDNIDNIIKDITNLLKQEKIDSGESSDDAPFMVDITNLINDLFYNDNEGQQQNTTETQTDSIESTDDKKP
jgi:hypothetical protein